ncbi:filamentous hemagglutinin-like protein [Calothrix parasitica NIES-267]|uniref:Filamentous hemagglutinin-like protein n=1 Tax=Calothrix parasitica NIES-267 TaxID=1973488 RepID=A0A1Z4LQM5_9CYAN|nr:filamentous hemagglutinin-like protein [Calothrix parasitica NIES-267]
MKGIEFLPGFITGLLISGLALPAFSQVTSDNTTNTTVNQSGNNFNIINGIQKGNNLFHSFKEFSIPTGGSATFNNSTDVVNIINRVTGGNISNIDGLIKANGNANLFLINPAGIVFGENAKLDIGGSFLGTTAESVLFKDGFEFSAVNPQNEALLTISIPVGLQMGSNPGNIQINNRGHNVSAPFTQTLRRGNSPSGLSVKTGKTLALLGGNVSLTGGIINSPDGQVELAAVATPDLVTIDSNNLGWTLNYGNVSGFGDIQLSQQSLVEASNTGAIRLAGNNLQFFDGSLLLLENQSNQSAVGIELQAAGEVEFAGISNTSISSGVISDARSSGKGGDITITADRIIGRDNGGRLRAYTFADADSGNITFNSRDITWKAGKQTDGLVEIRTLGTGNGGRLTINTERLLMQDSSFVSNVNRGSGNAGNVLINASDSVIVGPNSQFATLIGSSAVSANGNAGSISINTSRLAVLGGALISSSTYGSGDAGKITLKASESIEISGSGFFATSNRVEATQVQTSGRLLPEALRQFLGLPDIVTGSAGTININTPQLQITDGALVTVGHNSLGDAGKIQINSDSLKLDTQGKITATTASGEGGNINFNLQSDLILRNNSLIDTEAMGSGNGGNITINSPIIAGFENSDIIANAVEGNGGNIDITTQGIFGLEFRNELTEESDITASSQFGVNGTVAINNLSINPSTGLVELPVALSDSSQQIAQGCSTKSNSNFVATARGGIPQNPSQYLYSNRTWSDTRNLSTFPKPNNSSEVTSISNKLAIVEATGFIRNENGVIELVAAQNTPFNTTQVFNCSGLNT